MRISKTQVQLEKKKKRKDVKGTYNVARFYYFPYCNFSGKYGSMANAISVADPVDPVVMMPRK